MNKKKNIYKDKHGHSYIKQSYFIGGKQKTYKIHLIDGIPAEDFYEQNASDIELHINGDHHLIDQEKYNMEDDSDLPMNKEKPQNVKDMDNLPF